MDEQLIEKKDDEISLIDLFAVLWHRKIMIIVITAIAIVGVLIYSILSLKLPPEKVYINLKDIGNCGGSSPAIALAQAAVCANPSLI